jgi:putative inorganic carbon (hco3(-)) transporter
MLTLKNTPDSMTSWLAIPSMLLLVGCVLFVPSDLLTLSLSLLIFAICAMITPISAIAILLVLAPLRTLIFTESSIQLPMEIGQLTTLILILFWGLYTASRKKNPLSKLWTPEALPLLIFVITASLTLFYAFALSIAFVEWLKWLTIIVFALFTAQIANNNNIHWLVFILICAGIANASVGIYIYYGGSGALHLLINNENFRAFGTFGQPNPFGGFMGLLIPISSMMTLAYGYLLITKRQINPMWVLFFGIATLIMLFAIYTSWSRGAWLALAASLGFMAFALPRRLIHSILLATFVGILVLGLWFSGRLPASVVQRIQSSTEEFFAFEDMRGVDVNNENFAVVERLAHWQAALNMTQANPLGVGLGNYEVAYSQYNLINWTKALGHAHNYYLNILAEGGTLNLLTYSFFITSSLWFAWVSRKQPDIKHRLLSVGLCGSIVYLIFHSLLDNLYVNNLFLHIAFILGLIYFLHRNTISSVRLLDVKNIHNGIEIK